MASPEELSRLLRDALTNYYDPVRLQSHPLADMLNLQRGPGETVAEALRRCLRDGIDRLRPPHATPQDGPEWLGHRVLLLHYVRSQSPAEVCRELNLSEATFYRRQREALQALTSVMWNAHRLTSSDDDGDAPAPAETLTANEARGRAIALASRLPSELVQLSNLLEGVRQTIAPLAEQQRITLRVSVPPDLPPTYGDPAILRHAILSLLTGCVCATRHGTVELRVWPEAGRILGRIVARGQEAVAVGSWEEGQGFRLGVELLQVYGGDAWSEPGEAPCSIRFAVATLQPVSVLIVDDDRTTADLYRRYLEGPQYAVAHAQTAEEIDAALERSLPDVILLDVLLPRRDGWLILERLKADPTTAGIPVIVCSVIEQPELALALGAARVLTKPVTSEQLLRAVQEQTLPPNSQATTRQAGPAGA